MDQMSNGCVSIAALIQSGTDIAEKALIKAWARNSDWSQAACRANPVLSRRFLLGRTLVRALIARTIGAAGQDCEIYTKTNGKPFVRLASGNRGPAISISHSGAMIVAAATTLGSLGIDVEHHRRGRSFDAIASFAFGPREGQSARRSPTAFYRIWCLREAMSKASGNGLTEVTDKIDRVSAGPTIGAWEATIGARRWLLAHINPAKDYSLAIAVNRIDPASNMEWAEKSLDLWYPLGDGPSN